MVARFVKVTTALVAISALSACGSFGQRVAGDASVANDVSATKYPIQVASAKEEIFFVVEPHVFALSLEDKNKVAWFAETYKHVGHGEIWVVAPVGSANSPASIGAAAEIAKVMVERGISPRAIKMNSYQAAEGDNAAPLTVMYKRYHAYTRPCGNWNDNVAFSPTNVTSANFGCSTQSNLAALVVDPHDLMAPRGVDPADPARRTTVFDKYRQGEPTTSTRTGDDSGVVTDISNN